IPEHARMRGCHIQVSACSGIEPRFVEAKRQDDHICIADPREIVIDQIRPTLYSALQAYRRYAVRELKITPALTGRFEEVLSDIRTIDHPVQLVQHGKRRKLVHESVDT